MSLSKKETDDLKSMIDRTVQKFLGFSEGTLVIAAFNCLDKGYDQRKTVDKLSSILDDKQASKFTDKLFDTYSEFKSATKHARSSRKRERKEEEVVVTATPTEQPVSNVKRKRFDEAPAVPEPGQPSPGQLTNDKIKDLMANAQRMIQERKAQLAVTTGVPSAAGASSGSAGKVMMNDALEKAKKAAELQARIQAQMMNAGLGGGLGMGLGLGLGGLGVLGALGGVAGLAGAGLQPKSASQTQPSPLILDEQGRTIDAKTGEAIQLTQHMPTLKANIRAKRREQFKAVHDKPPEEITESRFFDSRVGTKGSARSKRLFKFHEPGKFQQLGGRLRTKAQLEKLQNEIAQAAKKTGIASAAKLATIQPKRQLLPDELPEVEWWDEVILPQESYVLHNQKGVERFEGITALIEHPTQMRPPAESTQPIQIPVMLTKKEKSTDWRQTRGEAQKELQEKIRLGLIPPPEPKVRMANLMRVLGTEAVQDPTKIEQHVREQMAKRQKAHEEANAARKLTKEQRRDKKIGKIKEDVSLGVHVSVYKVRDFSNPAKKFKVETNANQLYMTGIVVLHKDCNVIVVEGGPKQQKKFRRLMMVRIKWGEDKRKHRDEDDDSDEEEPKTNTCTLVWEGTVKNRAFGEMKFKMCPTESFAREQFKKHDMEHYWDLAYSSTVLEGAEDL